MRAGDDDEGDNGDGDGEDNGLFSALMEASDDGDGAGASAVSCAHSSSAGQSEYSLLCWDV